VSGNERSPRIRKRFTVIYGPGATPQDTGTVIDVSVDGVSIRGTTYSVGTDLRLIIRPADSPPFNLEGQVVWSKNGINQMGVRLKATDAAYRSFMLRATSGAPSAPLSPPTSNPPARPSFPPAARPGVATGAPTRPQQMPTPGLGVPRVSIPPKASPPNNVSGGPHPSATVPLRPAPSSPPPRYSEPPPVVRVGSSIAVPIAPALPGGGVGRMRIPRYPGQYQVRVTAAGAVQGEGYTVNLSRIGLSVTCSGEYKPGSRLTIVVSLPDGRGAKVSGLIVWVYAAENGTELGIRILHADDVYMRLVDQVARLNR
jgi:hypothetical protein